MVHGSCRWWRSGLVWLPGVSSYNVKAIAGLWRASVFQLFSLRVLRALRGFTFNLLCALRGETFRLRPSAVNLQANSTCSAGLEIQSNQADVRQL